MAFSQKLDADRSVPLSTKILALLLLLTWAFMGYAHYGGLGTQEEPEFDAPRAGIEFSYSLVPTGCTIVANGDRFLSYQDKFCIAPGCFMTDGSVDMLDTPYLQVGNPHDIIQGPISMTVEVSAAIRGDLILGTNFVILLIPSDIQITQFTTLRQARRLGVKIKLAGSTSRPR